ncbi:MAG TPA: hypothetical protein VGA27_00320 [Candidatus Binatia bacterium]
MKRSSTFILAGFLAGSLVVPGLWANAEAKDGVENHGQHKGWDKGHGNKVDDSTHDRRDFGHNQRFDHRDGRWDNHRRYPVRHDVRHDGRFDNRGHVNKPEIRSDFKDIRNARTEVKQDRGELRKDYTELRKDRLELRKDIRSGASKSEILADRKEIRGDVSEIRNDRVELRKDQNTLGSARQELKSDLRKR